VNTARKAETHLLSILSLAGVDKKATYKPGEVARILGLHPHTVHYLCAIYEPEDVGEVNPRGLFSLRTPGGHRRIPHKALEDWLEKNSSWERDYGIQGDLFGD